MKLSMQLSMMCAGFVLAGAVSARAQDAKDLYLSKCASCHGPDGAAKTARGKKLKMKSAHEATEKMSADDMIKIVTDGKGQDMSAYGKQFTKDQVKGLVDYYRGLGK